MKVLIVGGAGYLGGAVTDILLKEKVTILYSTSYLDEAERCRRVGLIHKGQLLRCDTPDNIKKESNVKTLEQAFIKIVNDYESKHGK